ncbi:MAG: hypothetical protein ACJ8J7_08850 [Sulfurifustaceae bacterium]
MAALPADHRLALARRVRLTDLADEQFADKPSRSRSALCQRGIPRLPGSGYSAAHRRRELHMSRMLSLIAAGVGVALLPEQVRFVPYQKFFV